MAPADSKPPPGEKKEKRAKTKPMPLDEASEYSEWAKKIPRPTPEDKGEQPPEAPQELREPREHGSDKPDKEGEKQ